MRAVKFKKWSLAVWVQNCKTPKKGTNKWDDDYIHSGIFHEWGSSYEEFENGAGNYTIALIELNSGEMVKVLPENVKFDSPS